MRAISPWKAVTVAVALIFSIPSASSAARMTRPPSGDCVFHRKVIPDGRWCSYRCNQSGGACAQIACHNGRWAPTLDCLEPFCSSRC
jgi:hypothetical protein